MSDNQQQKQPMSKEELGATAMVEAAKLTLSMVVKCPCPECAMVSVLALRAAARLATSAYRNATPEQFAKMEAVDAWLISRGGVARWQPTEHERAVILAGEAGAAEMVKAAVEEAKKP